MENKFFYLDESPIYKDKYIIRLNYNLFLFPTGIKGSYGVIIARLLNLSFANYLRYCRDQLDADLIGKNHLYIVPYFKKTETVQMFVRLLNNRMKLIKEEQQYPYEYKEEENGLINRIPFINNESNS